MQIRYLYQCDGSGLHSSVRQKFVHKICKLNTRYIIKCYVNIVTLLL